jgi:hypothetical protein
LPQFTIFGIFSEWISVSAISYFFSFVIFIVVEHPFSVLFAFTKPQAKKNA